MLDVYQMSLEWPHRRRTEVNWKNDKVMNFESYLQLNGVFSEAFKITFSALPLIMMHYSVVWAIYFTP